MKKLKLFVIATLFHFCVGTSFGQDIQVPGIARAITVRRDGRGIPYISAANDRDLYFAQGYVTASDRLWQMDLLRRVARGQTAEIFGKSTLEEDKRWRRFNVGDVAEKSLQYIAPKLRAALDSYASGVNAYIATLDGKTLPVEFRILQYSPGKWQPTDTIVIGKILADALSTTWTQDILRASLKKLPSEKFAEITNQVTADDVVLFGSDRKTAARSSIRSSDVSSSAISAASLNDRIREQSLDRIGLYAEGLAASNNWVISGKHTASGKPILANDPHLRPGVPGIWYLTELSAPGIHAAGVTFPGVPGIVLGHNDSIAWGATNVGPDVQDVYIETIDAQNNYKTPDGREPLKTRSEKIKVRTNPLQPETEIVYFDVSETRHGPIVMEDGATKYALGWTALDPRNTDLEAFFTVNRAANWLEFTKGLSTYGGAAQNFVYADRAGNIGWYAAGKIPIRRSGDGSVPYDGADSAGDWIGYIPFADLPHVYNPPSGLIVTANQRTAGTDYKYSAFSRDAAPPWRARRIFDLLDHKSKIDFNFVRDVQYDTYNIPIKRFADSVVKRNAASTVTVDLLKAWDGKMDPESSAALVANELRNCAAGKIAADNKPVPAFLIRERILQKAIDDDRQLWLPKAFPDFATMIRGCDTDITSDLQKRFGADRNQWTWGKVNVSRIPHPLAAVPFIGSQFATPLVSIGGSGQTPNVGSPVSMRFIASPGSWDETRQVIPLGESGDPLSGHYKDQFENWRTGTPELFPFSDAAISKAAVSTITLVPPTKN